MSPGQQTAPGGESRGQVIAATKTSVPRELPAVVDGAPARVVLDYKDTAAAFDAGRLYGRAEAVEHEAEARARELLLEQSQEWRRATLQLAAEKGPEWAEAMRMVCDQ